jgi:hypothetical protein
MAVLHIEINDSDEAYPVRIFINNVYGEREPVRLVQAVRFVADALNPKQYQLEMAFPSSVVIRSMADDARENHARQLAVIERFLRPPPDPPRPECPTAWEHVSRGLGMEDE